MNNWWDNPLAENPMGYNALQEMEAASGLNTSNQFPEGTDRLQSGLDVAALVPGVGDIAGPLADLRMMQQNPEQRTLANIALFGLGALPAVPSLMALMAINNKLTAGGGALTGVARAAKAKRQLGVIGYHGTRADFPTEEIYPLSHFGTRPQAANERLGMGPNGEVPDYIIKDWLTNTPGDVFGSGYLGTNIKRVDLNIKKPLRIADHDGNHNSILDYLKLAKDAKGITQKEYNALTDIWNYHANKNYAQGGFNSAKELLNDAETKTREALIKHLENKGYDGFVYTNDVEDVGKDSLIPFRNSQVEDAYGRESKYGTYENYHHTNSNKRFINPDPRDEAYYKAYPFELFDAKTGEVIENVKTIEEAKDMAKYLSVAKGKIVDYSNVYEEYKAALKRK